MKEMRGLQNTETVDKNKDWNLYFATSYLIMQNSQESK